eukprot:1496572-Prymnesium_polylepis.1
MDSMHSGGYESVIIEPEGIYFRQTSNPKASAEDVREEQDKEYAIAQVEDMKKEEQQAAASTLKKPLSDPATNPDDLKRQLAEKDAEISKWKAEAAEANKIDVNIVRRRLMDWLVINNSSEADRTLLQTICMRPSALL